MGSAAGRACLPTLVPKLFISSRRTGSRTRKPNTSEPCEYQRHHKHVTPKRPANPVEEASDRQSETREANTDPRTPASARGRHRLADRPCTHCTPYEATPIASPTRPISCGAMGSFGQYAFRDLFDFFRIVKQPRVFRAHRIRTDACPSIQLRARSLNDASPSDRSYKSALICKG